MKDTYIKITTTEVEVHRVDVEARLVEVSRHISGLNVTLEKLIKEKQDLENEMKEFEDK